MKRIVLILLIFSGLTKAQDTIRFRTGEIKVVKVNEVGLDNIKYIRFDNLTGPNYVIPKSDIALIRYASGYVDSFNVSSPSVKPIEKIQSQSKQISSVSQSPLSNEKIVIRGTDLFYAGKPIGEGKLNQLINQFPDQNKRSNLLKEFAVFRSHKQKQMLFFFSGLVIAVVVPYAGFIATVVTEDPLPLLVAVPAGVAVGATGIVIGGRQKKKKLRQQAHVAQLYNDYLP